MFDLYHVHHAYPGTTAMALSDVTLRIERGEFVVVSGPSGAGKSTLLRLLSGNHAAEQGQVLYDGKNLGRLHARELVMVRRKLACVFQDHRLLPHMCVLDNVVLALEVRGSASSLRVARAMQALVDVGLAHKAHALPLSLSGGEQQRVAVARALVGEPVALLCDEPTGNLDDDHAQGVAELLARAHQRGTTVVVTTHEPQRFHSATRTIQLVAGKVAHMGRGAA
jgi:cell division transport system ATP-binding protein